MAYTFDVIVIGNGVLGMSVAWHLSKLCPGIRLAVVGPRARPGCASLAAGAMLNSWAELEAGALEDPTLAARFSLSRRALDLWDAHAAALAEESGDAVPLTWGTYVIANSNSPEHEERAFDYMVSALQSDPESAGELNFLAPDPAVRLLAAARIPDGSVDSRKVIGALDTILDRLPNCDRVDATATKVVVLPSRDLAVELSQGHDLLGKILVLANGAYAQPLVDEIPVLKSTVPRLLFGGGTALDLTLRPNLPFPRELADLECVVRTMDRGGGCGMHLVPQGNGSFYFGASSSIGMQPDYQPRVHGLSVLVNGLVSEFHHAFANASIALRGPGFRPVTLDAFPLLGESVVPGIWFCNGTKRDGFTCSPLLAREIAKGIAGGCCELPEIFKPCRPLLSYRNRTQAIDAAVHSSIASETLNGLRLPPHRRDEWKLQHKQRVTAVYEKRDVGDFGIHPELLHFYDSDEMYQLLFP